MRKFLVLSLILVSTAFVVPSVEAAPSATAIDPQVIFQDERNRRGNRRWNNRVRRVVISTRTTRVGRYLYRETIRTTYLPNGRTRTQVISRVRLRRAW